MRIKAWMLARAVSLDFLIKLLSIKNDTTKSLMAD